MDGILLIDKPAGWTSFDVVAKVRGILRSGTRSSVVVSSKTTNYPAISTKIKVGHTGTLDPAATGLMIIVIGSYCKRASEFSKLDKTYQVELTLGKNSNTGDKEGELTDISVLQPTQEQVLEVVSSFVGKQLQTPPAYSAVKIDGQRAYNLARAGKEVFIQPREVVIHEIKDVKYKYPKILFNTHVSSGTYIRSLASDIGKKLGTGAFMSELRRTTVGVFSLKDSMVINDITLKKINDGIKLAK